MDAARLSPIETMWPRVRAIAVRLRRGRQIPRHVELEDLVSAGALGLMDAAARFDTARGVRFETFVGYRIRGAMVDYLRACDPLSRDQRRQVGDGIEAVQEMQLEHLSSWPDLAASVSDVTRPLVVRDLQRAIRRLPPREQRVIRHHFLLNRPLRDICQDLGVKASRASQLKTRALAQLRATLS